MNGAWPPLIVTGVDEQVMAAVHAIAGTACAETSELNVNVFADGVATPSLTVTVNVVCESPAVGVEPLIAPVDVLNESPDGSEPPVSA